MKFFTLIEGDKVHAHPNKKVLKASEFSTLVEANEILNQVKKEAANFRKEVAAECERLKEQGALDGFQKGLEEWNSKISALENEIASVRREMKESLVPLAIAAVKKIIGRELELKPETVVDIISTSLKAVSHHRKVSLFVNKNDLEIIESHRVHFKSLFEHLESLIIASRDDIAPNECMIETEAGIMAVRLENQLNALEKAFHSFLHKE